MTRIRRGTALLVIIIVTACGLPPERSARPIDPPGDQPSASTLTPGPTGTGARDETLYFVRDDQVAAVTRRVGQVPTVEVLVRDLLAGPTVTERDAGFTSALLGGQMVSRVEVDADLAAIELAATFDDTNRTDQILAVAQLVCTVAGAPAVDAVAFTRAGQRLGVPRADGSLTELPLTRADYDC